MSAPSIDWTGRCVASLGFTNLRKAVAWYRDVLGVAVVYELAELGWAELEACGASFRRETRTIEGTVELADFVDGAGNPPGLSQAPAG